MENALGKIPPPISPPPGWGWISKYLPEIPEPDPPTYFDLALRTLFILAIAGAAIAAVWGFN